MTTPNEGFDVAMGRRGRALLGMVTSFRGTSTTGNSRRIDGWRINGWRVAMLAGCNAASDPV